MEWSQPKIEQYVHMFYSVQKLQATYAGKIPITMDKHNWPQVAKGFKLQPPVARRRGVGRQRKNRIPSVLERKGNIVRQSKCANCGGLGHRKGSWRCPLTGTKKRKRKTNTKAGRPCKTTKVTEEAPMDAAAATTEEVHTLRTRLAAAREAAAAVLVAQSGPSEPLPQPFAMRRLPLEEIPSAAPVAIRRSPRVKLGAKKFVQVQETQKEQPMEHMMPLPTPSDGLAGPSNTTVPKKATPRKKLACRRKRSTQ